MKMQKSIELEVSSSNEDSHHISYSDFSQKSQQLKRKRSFKSNNPLVLLPADSSHQRSGKRSKNKPKAVSASSMWIVSPIEKRNVVESDSSDSHEEPYLQEDISAIYATSEDESKNFTQESFKELIKKADWASDTDSNESDVIFFQNMKRELSRKLKEPPKKKRKIKKADNVYIHPIYSKNIVILLMDHPASATICRYVSVEVLSGSVSVYGYQLKPQSPPLKVFSSKASGLVEIKTESCDAFWKKKNGFKSVSHELTRVTGSIEVTREILQESSNSSVVVVLEGCILPPHLQFLELYYPNIFKFRMNEKNLFRNPGNSKRIYCLPCCNDTLQFNSEAEDLATDVLAAIRSSQLQESEGPRVLVFGHKSTGKSTLLRYLVNKALSLFPAVFYLDADPGQAEFTPPAIVSMTQVTKPVIGPAFSHQKKPFVMSFTGSVSAESSPDVYSKSIAKLAYMFRKNLSREALFVNTMGWARGIGLECLKNVMLAVMPSVLIEIVTGEEDSMFDYRDYLTDNTRFYQIKCLPNASPSTDLNAERGRSMSLLSYFGKWVLPHEKPMYLNSFRPVCISWDIIPIYIFGSKVPPYRLVEAIIGSFVGLCSVHESLVLESIISALPKTLEEEPENDCLGFGIVRAVDESKHLLYIVTPMTLKELKCVNVIIKGNAVLPPAAFLEQPILETPLPFTDEAQIESTDDEVNIAKNYRRTVLKRNGRKKY